MNMRLWVYITSVCGIFSAQSAMLIAYADLKFYLKKVGAKINLYYVYTFL